MSLSSVVLPPSGQKYINAALKMCYLFYFPVFFPFLDDPSGRHDLKHIVAIIYLLFCLSAHCWSDSAATHWYIDSLIDVHSLPSTWCKHSC